MLRIVLIALVVYFGIKALALLYRSVRTGSAKARVKASKRDSQPDASEMVRDPVCGLYVSVRDAFPVTVSGVTIFFCSEKCLRSFIEGRG